MEDLVKRDRKHIWHPFTQEKTAPPPIAIHKAQGAMLFGSQGEKYYDLISSWWVTFHGHCHPHIINAIKKQAEQLDHVIFAGHTHEPAVELVEKLQKLLPDSLERFFFSDNGSTSIEVALKMTHQFWINIGYPERKEFLALEGGYHGDTCGAMSVGSSCGFFTPFKNLMFPTTFIKYPDIWIGREDIEAQEESALTHLSLLLEKYPNRFSACILEPLVQGASGMRMVRPEFIENLIQLLRKYQILVIFDEVMTGFGRTGTMFAMDQLNTFPDIVCLSKGVSGGVLPIALTITNQKIYQSFLSEDIARSFLHGHSYTANPIGCAAGIASLELFEKASTIDQINTIETIHRKGLALLGKNECVKKPRVLGSISAFTVDKHIASQLSIYMLNEGFLIRPLGSEVYLIPPYCIDMNTLNDAYSLMNKALLELTCCNRL